MLGDDATREGGEYQNKYQCWGDAEGMPPYLRVSTESCPVCAPCWGQPNQKRSLERSRCKLIKALRGCYETQGHNETIRREYQNVIMNNNGEVLKVLYMVIWARGGAQGPERSMRYR